MTLRPAVNAPGHHASTRKSSRWTGWSATMRAAPCTFSPRSLTSSPSPTDGPTTASSSAVLARASSRARALRRRPVQRDPLEQDRRSLRGPRAAGRRPELQAAVADGNRGRIVGVAEVGAAEDGRGCQLITKGFFGMMGEGRDQIWRRLDSSDEVTDARPDRLRQLNCLRSAPPGYCMGTGM